MDSPKYSMKYNILFSSHNHIDGLTSNSILHSIFSFSRWRLCWRGATISCVFGSKNVNIHVGKETIITKIILITNNAYGTLRIQVFVIIKHA